MRQLLCVKCGHQAGRREIVPASEEDGTPAEWERVVYGHARVPTDLQRTVWINGAPTQLATNAWDCDQCMGAIKPNDVAFCRTIWTTDQPEPDAWEHEYLSPLDESAP